MNDQAVKFVTEVVKPWERLNVELAKPYSVSPKISDLTQQASSLAVNISHLPEAVGGQKPAELSKNSKYYEVITDLADSSKHGALRKAGRQSEISVASMFERNGDGKVRFLRNVINLQHGGYGIVDFMHYAVEAAKYIANDLSIRTSWNPQIVTNSGPFSSKIKVHASADNQVYWKGMQLQFVRRRDDGEYEPTELDSTVEFELTSDL